ncbi:potassium channel family protein [Phaeobacter marinintestinus]|uniref:potassium channel family protein n=1 Tax=Falsiphaeobacter marinintestinus TaxID=1492905 RepID=UPI0011B43FAA|nr:potassium channel family protein [Phaeobacter marinintestinus]
MIKLKPSTIIVSLLAVVAGSTVFFHIVEGWSWIDSYFFTMVTISTVGYGQLVPATIVGKLATTALIFVGLGVFAVAIQQFAFYHMRKREEHTEWLVARLGHQQEPKEQQAANRDDPPDS